MKRKRLNVGSDSSFHFILPAASTLYINILNVSRFYMHVRMSSQTTNVEIRREEEQEQEQRDFLQTEEHKERKQETLFISSMQPDCRLSKLFLFILDKICDCFPSDRENSRDEEELYLEKKEKKKRSKEEMGRRRCLCDTVLPILKLSQFVGIVPLTLYHPPRGRAIEAYSESSCQMVFRWKSVAVLVNTILTLLFLGFLPFSFTEIKNRMSEVFKGTDLYTFTIQTVAMIFETTVLLLAGRFCRCRFIKAWSALNEVYHAMCDDCGSLKRIKVGSYIATIIISMELVGFYAFNFWTFSSVNKSVGFYQSCFGVLLGSLIVNLTLSIPCIFSTLFLFICLLIRSHFLKISEMLTSVLKKPESPKLYTKIDALRVLHEQLVSAVSEFEKFFGVQILLTLSTGCFTVTTGIYACIVQGEGISSSVTQEFHTTAWWGCQMYSAALLILFILISGQLVTIAAMSPCPVLNSLALSELDEKSQVQISAFLYKISAFPTKISAVGITSVGVSFLASATTTIITYLLVLIQFKLTMESKWMNPSNPTFSSHLKFSNDGNETLFLV